jgi:LPS-assembly lipoprotein
MLSLIRYHLFTRTLVVALSMAMLLVATSCGFRLRGSFNVPSELSPLYIQNRSSDSELYEQLVMTFEINKTTLVDRASAANYRLIIISLISERRTAAIGAGALAIEYELIEEVTFELRDKQDTLVMEPTMIVERRILDNDPNQVISSSEEEALIRREMKQNLAIKIVRRISAADLSGG